MRSSVVGKRKYEDVFWYAISIDLFVDAVGQTNLIRQSQLLSIALESLAVKFAKMCGLTERQIQSKAFRDKLSDLAKDKTKGARRRRVLGWIGTQSNPPKRYDVVKVRNSLVHSGTRNDRTLPAWNIRCRLKCMFLDILLSWLGYWGKYTERP